MSAPAKPLPAGLTIACSAAGGVTGWFPVHPMEVLKTRLQAKPGSTLPHLLRATVSEEGMRGLYSGLSAAIARQLVYTPIRLGLFEVLRDRWSGGDPSRVTFEMRMGISMFAGGTASVVNCPIEVSLVRMYNDARLPAEQRRNYSSVFNAVARIGREEGVMTYWRGCTPTVARSCIVAATQIGCYDQFKATLVGSGWYGEGPALHLSAAVLAGFLCALVSNPVDTCKTRIQGQVPLPDGTLQYRNLPQTAARILRSDGPLALFSGFPPYCALVAGHTIGMFLCLEQYKILARRLSEQGRE